MGKAGEIETVRDFASARPEVTLIEDPTRSVIFGELNRSRALILFSQPSGIWKEQVGLPIVEALSYGCEIISSDETGIEGWLREHGHRVLPWSSTSESIAAAALAALESDRTVGEILSDLPDRDGRLGADDFLFAP
jgi:glycosyltransferase involved in cell wall biosynthesis